MNSIKKYNLFALMVIAFVMVRTTKKIDAFSTSPALSQVNRPSATSLHLKDSSNDQERRGFFSSVKRLFGASVLVAGTTGGKSVPVLADETDAKSSGTIVEIQVSNLDGGSTGTIKIQMKPEWAPRGVARFEVSSSMYRIGGSSKDVQIRTRHLTFVSFSLFYSIEGTRNEWLL